MTLRSLIPINSSIFRTRAETIIKLLRRKIQGVSSIEDSFNVLFDSLKEFYTKAGEPFLERRLLNAKGFRNKEEIEKTLQEIEQDLTVLFEESKALSQSAANFFNLQQNIETALDSHIKQTTCKSLDLKIITRVGGNSFLVAGDDFIDSSKIDLVLSGQNPLEVSRNGSVLTLGRDSANNLSPNSVIEDILVDNNEDKVSVKIGENELIIRKAYEGKFYALSGEMIPEGGTLKFQRRPKGKLDDLTKSNIEQGSSPISDSFEVKISNTDNDISLRSARNKKRQDMIDGNPDTFWQIERVVDIPNKIIKIDPTKFDPEEDTLIKGLRNLDSNIDKALSAPESPININLTVSIIIDLGPGPFSGGHIINWIDINPFNFDSKNWLTVDEILTQGPGETDFLPIEHISDGRFANILTDEANKSLDDEQVSITLSANRFQYTGQGIFVFTPRLVRKIKITLTQNVLAVVPYETIGVVFNRDTLTSVHNHGHDTRFKSNIQNIKKVLPYELSLKLKNEQITDKELTILLGLPQKTKTLNVSFIARYLQAQGKDFSSSIKDVTGILDGAVSPGSILGDALNETGNNTHVGLNLDPFVKKDIFDVVKFDKARYAIGIRDINIFSNSYLSEGQMVSVPFKTPKNISKVALEVSERSLPPQFNRNEPWSKYFISVDDGNTWNQIRPITDNSTDEQRVPKIYQINSKELPENRDPRKGFIDIDKDVKQIRFKVIFNRPDNIDNAEFFTPALESYRLKLVMEESL